MEIEFKILDGEREALKSVGVEERIGIFYWRMNALSAIEKYDSLDHTSGRYLT